MLVQNTKFSWLMGCALLAAGPMVAAQTEEAATNGDEIRQQIQQARTELAEAARRMARLQRELAAQGEAIEGFSLRPSETGEESETDIEIYMENIDSLRTIGIPPRLGVLLGGADSGQGNEIVGLTPGSGAEEAGIEQGDRLISVNGQPVAEGAPASVRKALKGVEAGTTVEVVVDRNGERLDFDVETSSVLRDVRVKFARLAPEADRHEREIVIMRPDAPRIGGLPSPPFPPEGPRFSGLGRDSDLISNHAGLQPYFGTADGVVVLRIDPDNAFGLEDGDVVLSLDSEPVGRPVELGRMVLSREPGEQVVLEVMRRGTLVQLEVSIPERSESLSSLRHFELRIAPPPPRPAEPPQAL